MIDVVLNSILIICLLILGTIFVNRIVIMLPRDERSKLTTEKKFDRT